jgi:hypothetical protein
VPARKNSQWAGKPGFVRRLRGVTAISLRCRLLGTSSSLPGSHRRIGPIRAGALHPGCSLFGLAPSGVCLARPVTRPAGELLPHRFTLTPREASLARGGLLSVALSLTSRPVGVTHHCVLWSPDFPLAWLVARPATVWPTANCFGSSENRNPRELGDVPAAPLVLRFACTPSSRHPVASATCTKQARKHGDWGVEWNRLQKIYVPYRTHR